MSSTINLPPQPELPDWMRRAQRGVDWGLLLVLGICLIVSAPFLMRGELPHTNASENYVYRTNDYADAIREGWLYPRWSPNVLGGYGAPIPNFYAPAAPYAAAIFQVLLTNSPVSAVRLLYIFAICAAGLSVYALVMRRSGAAVGILAAMLYVYSPYISLTVPHIQGDLVTMILLGLTPALLWATDRLVMNNQPQNMLLVSLFATSLMLTDIKGAVIAYLLAMIFALWNARRNRSTIGIFRFISTVGLGILLSGFFWMPALLEQGAIHWQSNGEPAPLLMRLNDIIAPIRALDPADMIPRPQFSLGIVGFLFVVGGSISIIVRRRFDVGGFFLVIGLIGTAVALILVPTETHLFAIVVLCASVVGSHVLLLATKLPARRQRLALPILMVTIWIGSTTVWSPPEAKEPFGTTDGTAQVNYEQQGYGVAVLPSGAEIPSTLSGKLAPSPYLIDGYQAGSINKLAPGQISGNIRLSPLSHSTHNDRFQLGSVSSPVTINFLTAYFPGWRAAVGDQRINIQPNSSTGLIQIEMPILNINNGELSITFGTTSVRYGSWLISGVALLIITILTWGKFRTSRKNFIDHLILLKQEEARLIALPICCFGIVAFLVLIPNPYINVSASPNVGLANSYSTQLRSSTGLTLNAFRLSHNVYTKDETLEITLFWQAQRFLPKNYLVKLFLVNNNDGSRWNETALRYPGFYPTRRWNTRQYVNDEYRLRLEKNIPSGNYQIHVEAFDCAETCTTDERLEFYNITGQALGEDLTLPTLITITS